MTLDKRIEIYKGEVDLTTGIYVGKSVINYFRFIKKGVKKMPLKKLFFNAHFEYASYREFPYNFPIVFFCQN